MNKINAQKRFSGRVENYVKYRPVYPIELSNYLKKARIIDSGKIIADIGSGTGISAKIFLDEDCIVYGIEPNKEMRQAGEFFLENHPKFNSINGSAENTGLSDSSVDCIVAAQAFHWFNQDDCKREFKRILKEGGYILLIWNERITDSTDFLIAYEKLLLDYSIDYRKVNHKNIDESIILNFFSFFIPDVKNVIIWRGPNYQVFDYQGLEGRLLSSSYVPEKGQANYEAMLIELQRIFALYKVEGKVTIEYETVVYIMRYECEL
jgi:SAM-dependent methyltransferase